MYMTPSGRSINTTRNWDYEDLQYFLRIDKQMYKTFDVNPSENYLKICKSRLEKELLGRNNEEIVFISEKDLFRDWHVQECQKLMNLTKKDHK